MSATIKSILAELETFGSPNTVKIYRKHGADGPMFGVKVGDLKKVLKKIKGDQELAMKLWETGNSDAMYLASLAADGSKMTKAQHDKWAKGAWWYMLSEFAVPYVAHEHPDGTTLALKWMKAKQPGVASSGWATYAAILSTRPDEELDLKEIKALLGTVERDIAKAPDRVRYAMNGFVISVGSYVKPLLAAAKATAKKIGKVEVNMGETSCKVPAAPECIKKIEDLGRVGRKRKTAKC